MLKNVLLFLILIPYTLFAGVIITSNQGGETTKTYIQGEIIKFTSNNFEMIFNGKKKVLYSIDHKNKTVTIVTKNDLNMLKQFGSMYGYQNSAQQTDVKMVKVGRKTVAGCRTTGYKFFENGQLTSEIYFCKDKKLLKVVNPKLEEEFFEFSSMSNKEDYKYKYVNRYGFPFYSKDYRDGSIYKVISVKYKNISKKTFSYPTNYKIIRMSDMYKKFPGMQGFPMN